MSYARAGNWVGCVKSTVCKWLRKAPLAVPRLPPDGTLELDGLWTRTRTGRTELKVIRDAAAGTALGAFGSWAEVIDRAWQLGAQRPAHLVSDGDGAIAAGIELVYGGEAAHQLCAFHLLREEYRRNIGTAGFAAARRLLDTGSLWGKVGNGRGGLCGRRMGRRVAGAGKRCPKDGVIWRRGRWRIGRCRDWSGTTGSCDGGSSWGRYGRNTTCWRCCHSRGLVN